MPRRKRIRPFAPVEYETATPTLDPPSRPSSGTPFVQTTRKTLNIDFDKFSRRVDAEKCRRSLWHYTRAMWLITDPGTPFVDNWHIGHICECLEAITLGQLRHLIINIPPGFAKSRISCVAWPSWEWLDRPWISSLFGSYDDKLAHRDSDLCRMVIDSPWYQETFEPDWGFSKSQNAKGFYRNTKQGFRFAFGMGSRFKTGWRGQKVVVDDPLSAEDRFDENVKAGVNDTWDKTLSTRVNNAAEAAFVLIMQRLAHNDLTGHLLDRNEKLLKEDPTGKLLLDLGYQHLMLPTRFEKDRSSKVYFFNGQTVEDPRKEEGELLFPALFPPKVIDEFETLTLGPDDFSAQHQHRPVKEGAGKFRKEWFRYYSFPDPNNRRIITLHTPEGDKYARLDTGWSMVAMDVANGVKRANDWSVILVGGVTKDYELILLQRYKVKLEGPPLIDLCKQVHSRRFVNGNSHLKWCVESNGLGLPNAQNMLAAGLPVEMVHVNTDKLVESTTARVRYGAGFIYHPQPSDADWIEDYEKQLELFPDIAHDDDISAISLFANGLYGAPLGGIVDSQGVKTIEQVQDVHANIRDKFSARNGAGGTHMDEKRNGPAERWRAK